ncbi:TPA: protein LvrA [Legionella anisa]
MHFLFVNAQELEALMELPYIQRLAYLMGIRPYMDRETCIVGIKRRISYQSLRETLYVAPIAGVKTGSPSQQQVKRAVKSLERAGLIEIKSTTRHLILKCLLAEGHQSFPKQADPRPTPKAAINPKQFWPFKI